MLKIVKMIWKNLMTESLKSSFLTLFFCLFAGVAFAQEKTYTLQDINIRDPFILPVEKEGTYYMYASSSASENGKSYGGMIAYKSADLKTWHGPVRVFDVPRDNYLTGTVWAPEVHKYRGKYYLFATLNTDIEWKKAPKGATPFRHRCTQIFWSKKPEGPFLPFEEKLPHTPLDQMALDGTLWVEDGVPYMVYCHEWVQVRDGGMNLVRLKKDLSGTDGQAVRLFNASSAEWSTGDGPEAAKHYVTDGCFLHRSKTGKLLMVWSSFKEGVYAVGIAESATGRITGPWIQQKEPIFVNGGHSMLFTDFQGRLCMVLHSPNSPSGKERAKIFELEDMGHTLRVKGEITE